MYLSPRKLSSLLILLLSFSPILSAKGKTPTWLSEAMDFGDAYKRIEPDAESLVLYDSRVVEYLGSGKVTSLVRRAVHLKSRSERGLAMAYVPLYNKSQVLKSMKAWLVYPSGKIEVLGKKDGFMKALDSDALHSESMVYVLDRSSSVISDDIVFAYEYVVNEKTNFLQEMWHFQSQSPVLYSSFHLTLPKGWSAEGVVLNCDSVNENVSENTYKWEGTDFSSVDLEEEGRLPHRRLLAQVGVSIYPPEKELSSFVFRSWNDLSKFGYDAFEQRSEPNAAIAQKTNELVVGLESDWEKVKAIARYVQSVNYMQINVDVNYGGGYEPHEAATVFERHFGDCKDKSVLTISMLKTQGIEAFPVSASVGNESYVFDEWPSPYHFDHCIVAIPVSDEVERKAVVRDGSDRFLIFDPTSENTPIGFLPRSLQGTKVLVETGSSGELIELPIEKPENAVIRRVVDVKLDENGHLKGSIVDNAAGSMATSLRYMYRSLNKKDFQEIMQEWVSDRTRDAKILSVECEDYFEENKFILKIDFESKYYGRALSRKTMMFKPVFLNRREWVPPSEKERKSDFVSSSFKISELIRFELLDAVSLKESPKPFDVHSDFADYSLESSIDGNVVTVLRNWESRYQEIPVDRYQEVVDFYEKVTRADGRPLVIGFE